MTCPIEAKKSSFRGVEFHHDSGSVQGGRRGATHEYPFREEHYDEDLGKRARRFSVAGYVTAPNVRDKLGELEISLSAPGHGLYYDAWTNRELLCRCESYSIDVSRRDLTRGSFTASFVERGIEPAPTAIRTAVAALNGALSQFNEALATGYNIINGTTQSVENAIAGFRLGGSYFDTAHRQNFATSNDVIETRRRLDDASPFVDGKQAVEDATDAVIDAQDDDQRIPFLNTLANIDGTGDPEVANQALVFGGVGLSRYAEIVVSQDYTSRQDAATQINEFVATAQRFMAMAEDAGLSDLAKEALCLASLAGDRVTTELGDLPIVRYVDGAGKPAIILSHQLFGDIDAAKELMRENAAVSGSAMTGDIGYVIADRT